MNRNPTRIKNSMYKRPTKTYTEKLTQEDIDDLLDDYKMIDDLSKVPIGSHLRYCTVDKNGKKKFRLGGFLHKNNGLPKYVILSNNNVTWTVQITNTQFFRKMNIKEIKNEYEEEIEEIKQEYQKYIKKLEHDIKILKKMVKKLQQ